MSTSGRAAFSFLNNEDAFFIANFKNANCNSKLDTPWQVALVADGAAGSIRERGFRSRQAAKTTSRKASNSSSGVL